MAFESSTMADSTPPVAGGMEGIEYSIIEQVEVLPNMFSIVADPSNEVASADPVATQLISDMDEQDEDNEINDDNEISDAERSVEPAPSIIVVTTHANGNVQNNVQDENESPNRPTKRAPNPGYQMTNKKHATSTMKFHAFQVNWSKISDTLLKRITSLQEYRLEHPHSAVPRLIRLKKLKCVPSSTASLTNSASSIQTYPQQSWKPSQGKCLPSIPALRFWMTMASAMA